MYTDHAILIAQIMVDVAYLRGVEAAIELRPAGYSGARSGSAYGWTARVGRDNWEYKVNAPSVAHAIEDLAALVGAERLQAEAEEAAAALEDDGAETIVDVPERDTLRGMPVSVRVA